MIIREYLRSKIAQGFKQAVSTLSIFSLLAANPPLLRTVLTLSPFSSAFAASSTTSTTGIPNASTANLEDFNKYCKSTLAENASLASQDPKYSYCTSADDSIKAMNSQANLWKVWAAVAGVCVAACVTSFVGFGNQYICTAANVGASITDGVITKNFATAISGIGSAVVSMGTNSLLNSRTKNKDGDKDNHSSSKDDRDGNGDSDKSSKNTGKNTGNDTKTASNNKNSLGSGRSVASEAESTKSKWADKMRTSQKDVGACLQGAAAAMQSYSNFNSMKGSETSAKTNLASAQGVQNSPNSNSVSNLGTLGSNHFSDSNKGLSGSSSTNKNTASAQSNSNNPSSQASVCNSSQTLPSAGVSIQCAVASAPNIPAFVSQPKFASDFNKASGGTLSNFLTNSASPSSSSPTTAMASATSAALTPEQSVKMGSVLRQMEKQMLYGSSNSTYSGAGANAAATSDNPEAQLNTMMTNLMGQFAPKTGTPEQVPSAGNEINLVVLANQNRSPASISEDRTLNLFDRITYRYHQFRLPYSSNNSDASLKN